MVRNSAKLDCRTKQHTQFGVSVSNGSRDMGRTKSWWKKKETKRKKNECRQSHKASPTGIANNEDPKVYREKISKSRMDEWQSKPMHGQFLR